MADDPVVREWTHGDDGAIWETDRDEHNAVVRAHLDLLNRFDNANSLLEAANASIKRLQGKLTASEAARGRMREALENWLENYGEHHYDCPLYGDFVAETCTCGLTEALAKVTDEISRDR